MTFLYLSTVTAILLMSVDSSHLSYVSSELKTSTNARMYSPITRKIELPGDDVQSITLHIQLQTNRNDPSGRRPSPNRDDPHGESPHEEIDDSGGEVRELRGVPVEIRPAAPYRQRSHEDTGMPSAQYQENPILFASPEQSPHQSPRNTPAPRRASSSASEILAPPARRSPNRPSPVVIEYGSPREESTSEEVPWEVSLLSGIVSGGSKTYIERIDKQKILVRQNPPKKEWTQPKLEITKTAVYKDVRNRQWTRNKKRKTVVESE